VLWALVDQSMVAAPDPGARYVLLETLRHYARQRSRSAQPGVAPRSSSAISAARRAARPPCRCIAVEAAGDLLLRRRGRRRLSPAVACFVGGTMADAAAITEQTALISVGRSTRFKLPT
jgi:hypothetical protein